MEYLYINCCNWKMMSNIELRDLHFLPYNLSEAVARRETIKEQRTKGESLKAGEESAKELNDATSEHFIISEQTTVYRVYKN